MSRVIHYVKLYKCLESNKMISSQVHEWFDLSVLA